MKWYVWSKDIFWALKQFHPTPMEGDLEYEAEIVVQHHVAEEAGFII